MTDYSQIPERLLAGLDRWIRYGIAPGHFLTAVLRNDLRGAYSYGDPESIAALPLIMRFLYNEAPSACHGLPARFDDWLLEREERGAYAAWKPRSAEEQEALARRERIAAGGDQ